MQLSRHDCCCTACLVRQLFPATYSWESLCALAGSSMYPTLLTRKVFAVSAASTVLLWSVAVRWRG